MKNFSFYLKYFFFVIFFIPYSLAFSNTLLFQGLSKLTIDDIQSLTTIDIYKDEISEIDLNSISKDLYRSDLIYDIDYIIKDNKIFFSIVENNIIEDIYFNGNVTK